MKQAIFVKNQVSRPEQSNVNGARITISKLCFYVQFLGQIFTQLEAGRLGGEIILERTDDRKIMQANNQHFIMVFSKMDTIPIFYIVQQFYFHSL